MDAVVQMVMDFCLALRKSKKKLHHYCRILTTREDFDVIEALRDISNHRKCINAPDLVPENIRRCLEAVRLINIVTNRVVALKAEPVSGGNAQHVELLEQFWLNMKGERRRGRDFISSEWLELGFQGSDPSTDFRSMGALSLVQLVHFSKYRPEAAKLILNLFSKNTCYFPFAIIGVNITRFVLELIDELRIFRVLVENLGHVVAGDLSTYEIMPSEDAVCINFGLGVVHDFYCVIFEEFYLQWVIINPANVMQFADIFEIVKASIRRKYIALP